MVNDTKNKVLDIVSSKGPISAHNIASLAEVSRQYVHRVLSDLQKQGLVVKQGSSPKVVYSSSSSAKSSNVVLQNYEVTKEDRLSRNEQRATVLWFTGLSGAGKSTLANAVEKRLFELSKHTYVLDGDNVRHGLNRDLTFEARDRTENIRRIGEVSKLFVDAGIMVMTAFISPYITDRNMVRSLLSEGEFVEVHVSCPLEVCESRDIKGLYKKARQGIITNFTGIDAPYEAPRNPELVLKTNKYSIDECVDQTIEFLTKNNYIKV